MLLRPLGVAVSSITADGFARACISRVSPVTAPCASSTIISGALRCNTLANENRGDPSSFSSSPGVPGGRPVKKLSRFSSWA